MAEKKGYETNKWAGLPHYECTHESPEGFRDCAFDTLEEDLMKAHQDNHPYRDPLPVLLDSRGRVMEPSASEASPRSQAHDARETKASEAAARETVARETKSPDPDKK